MGGTNSKQPDYWEKDQDHPTCQLCDVQFSVRRRRHHCRACGGVFCAACTARQAPVLDRGFKDPVRICDRCTLRQGTAGIGGLGIGATSRSSTGAAGGMQRSNSMDPTMAGAFGRSGSDSGNAANSRTPRTASSLAVMEAERRRGAVTPRSAVSGLGSPSGGRGNAAAAAVQRGQFLNEAGRGSAGGSQNAAAAASSGRPPIPPPAAAANNNSNAASSISNAKVAPTPARYISAALRVMCLQSKFRSKLNGNDRSRIGAVVMSFLRQPSVWVERTSVNAHRNYLTGGGDINADWSRIVLRQRVPSGLAGAGGNKMSPAALFIAAPTLPSTRAATVSLYLRCPTLAQSLRSLQVGVVHDSSISTRTRPTSPPSAHCVAVSSLSTARIPAIGISFEGSSFVGTKTEPLEFFRLADGVTAVVLSVTFDQTSGNVAFTLHNASGSTASSGNSAPTPREAATAANSGAAVGEATAAAGALPVIAAHACALPSGVAGKWNAAFSVDTSALDAASALVAEWL